MYDFMKKTTVPALLKIEERVYFAECIGLKYMYLRFSPYIELAFRVHAHPAGIFIGNWDSIKGPNQQTCARATRKQ